MSKITKPQNISGLSLTRQTPNLAMFYKFSNHCLVQAFGVCVVTREFFSENKSSALTLKSHINVDIKAKTGRPGLNSGLNHLS